MRIGLASILQETNTFSVLPTTFEDFRLASGEDVLEVVAGTNSELAGALRVLEDHEATPIPLLYAWAMPSGRLTGETFESLRRLLVSRLEDAGRLDAVVLSLHGAMAAEDIHDADGELINATREVVGNETPVAISLDLHANVTSRMVAGADSVSAYHTDPHVDMAEAGARAAERACWMSATGTRPATGLAKRPMIVPAETMNTTSGTLARIRAEAMRSAPHDLVELCLFPVQPWLDVPEVGLGVVVTTRSDKSVADRLADHIASTIWDRRDEFVVDRMMKPRDALRTARASSVRPFIIAESADAPTAGAAGDSPAMVAATLESETDLVVYVPVVDPGSVARCHEEGVGSRIRLEVGASVDDRWWDPVALEGEVLGLGDGTYRLQGASFTGMEVSMGRFATVASGCLRLLLTERPAWTSDPATYLYAGLAPDRADVIVLRSCSDFIPNFPGAASEAVTLDVPGAATPRLDGLRFENQARPPYPIESWRDMDTKSSERGAMRT